MSRSALNIRRPFVLSASVLALVWVLAPAAPWAQAPARRAMTVDDYTKWRNITSQELSADGKWVAYGVAFANTTTAESKPVLHLLNLETNQDVAVPNATGASFSADSKWIAYQVDPTAAGRGGRAGRAGGAGAGGGGTTPNTTPGTAPGQTPGTTPATQTEGRGGTTPPEPRRVELRNLQSGAIRSWQDIATFQFSANATHLMLRRRPAQPAGGAGRGGDAAAPAAPAGGGAEAPAGPRGVDVTIHNLQTGRDHTLGSVGDISFNKTGELLAYTVDAAVKDTNGLFVLDLRNARLSPLDNDAKLYNRLTWNDSGTALAVLKGLDVEKMRERNNVLVVYPDVQAALGDNSEPPPAILDPAKSDAFPKGWVISDRAALGWSEDNKRVFFGMKEQVPTPEARRRNTDEAADVDVWRTSDERIQSVQMIRADADRNFTFREAFDLSTGRFVKLADDTMRDLEIAADGKWAVGRDTRGYIHDYKRPAADLYRVNTSTGERKLMLKGQLIGQHVLGISPDGRTYLYWKDSKFQAYDLEAGTSRTLGNGTAAPVNFTDMEDDHPGPRGTYGIAGYAADGRSVIANHRYDLWAVPLDGSAPRNLTSGLGAKNEVRYRFVRTIPADPLTTTRLQRQTYDLSKPIVLSTYGEYTKKSGFAELANGQLKELINEDAVFSTPSRALKAETYLFTRQTFVEFPDLRISGPGFKASKRITDINPQQSEYLWGRRILFDYKNRTGVRLQGILALPDDYKTGEKRPMLVTFYEKNSQNMHRYSSPSYITGMGAMPIQATTEGYITMLPDVHFHTGSSHSDMLDAVEAAVRKVIEMGYVDPKRIGVHGHSYGGEGAAFIGTRSKLFAAVGMGAGVTDLYSDFSQSWGWSYQVTGGSGANGNDYYLYGQGRWGFSPWDKPDVYRFESALTHAPEAVAPFLIMHGTADPTVAFSEGMNFYNALRYNNKVAYMLAYPNEGHGLRGLANRKDLTVRYFEFFNHYLKGAPAPKWMTEGVPFIKKAS